MEASRSTNPSPDSYVGSLISLISKAEIRYEGILFNINTQESSIALRNVRSFGSEGRKKDGPQVPPSDKVYEYILFRGSDIKDLHVKSSPPVQTTASIYNDPAIIQSHIPQEAATSTSLPYSSTRSQQDFNSYTSQLGLPKSSPQSSAPLYQPGVSLGSWGSSYPLPTTNNIMPAPTYLQGIQGAADGLQTQQQSLLQPPSRLLTPPSVHQTMPYPAMSAPLPSRSSAVPIPPFLDTPSPLLPSFSPTAPNVHSPFLPSHTSALPADSTTVLNPNKGPMQGLRSADMSTTSLQLVTPPTTTLDEGVFPTAGAVQPKSAEPTLTFNNILESEQHISGSSGSFPKRGLAPPLVTPNQFVQPGTAIMPSSQSSQSIQKDVEMVQISSTIPRLQTIPGAQAPLLPLPTSVDYKMHGDPLHSHHNNRGRGRGRGHWASHNVTYFTEDFDFVSMNEKFNKDEVWGQLGKKNATLEDGYSRDKDNVGKRTSETKPVYVKDDFFDSLSSNATGGSHRGRSIFSEGKKLNTETFGNAARHRVGHGGRGYGRSGHGFDRGGQGFDRRGLGRDGFGYNPVGGGFGHGGQSRDGRNSGRSYGYNERGGWGHHAT